MTLPYCHRTKPNCRDRRVQIAHFLVLCTRLSAGSTDRAVTCRCVAHSAGCAFAEAERLMFFRARNRLRDSHLDVEAKPGSPFGPRTRGCRGQDDLIGIEAL